MTLDGTNTWVLHEPGASRALVLDPGPDDQSHLSAVADAVAARGASIAGILLTHGHADHSAGAARLAAEHGVGVRALDPSHRLGDEGLVDGELVRCEGLELRVLGTPGHTGDSLSFLLEADGGLLTGDTVLGRGSTVVAHPDGRLADYLGSLELLRRSAEASGARHVLTGHGPVLGDPIAAIDGYLAHRHERLDQVRAALARLGAIDRGDHGALVEAIVEMVYADVPTLLWPAAALSVRAQLEYLRDAGEA
jgi:glyoxylase-like metal-dependent hydrolase (beta-lactamase superfamily II)